MPESPAPLPLTIALAGNPNAGKTTIFNRLTGSHQKVGNWGGVTVEKKEGRLQHAGREIRVVDLPGIYSLTAYSIEEIVARDYILEEKPEVVVVILDATNLERNLYLATQLIELNIKLVFAMNMVDAAEARGIETDYHLLESLLGVPIVQTVGTRGQGLSELLDAVLAVAADQHSSARHIHVNYGREVETEIAALKQAIARDPELKTRYYPRWLAVKLLEVDRHILDKVKASPAQAAILAQLAASTRHLGTIFPQDEAGTLITDGRYGFIGGAVKEAQKLSRAERITLTDQADRLLTNRFLGFPVLLLFMYLLFNGTFTLGEYPMSWIEQGVEWCSGRVAALLPDGLLEDLLVNGIIGGVGGVIVFLPNILILYLGISLMEDTGYMARAAFIMDRVMHTLGLHGKSFIPMIMGFGCNVPAIMATRTLESRRDRLLTILINPLMSCSARLPVYILFAGAFFPDREGNVIFSIYLLGIVLAILMGQLFKRTLFRGEIAPFVMELPPYRMPTLNTIVIHMWEKTAVYLQKMGGVVLCFAIVVWFLGAFPRQTAEDASYQARIAAVETRLAAAPDLPSQEALQAELQTVRRAWHRQQVENSYIGRMGRFIEPVLRPLGFDWRMSVSLLTGFVAKEIVVSSMGVLYQVGDEAEATSEGLRRALQASGLSPVVAYAFMVFVLIYTPCLVSVITIWRETRSLAWMAFSIAYLVVLAWAVAFAIRRAGAFLGWG
ncbi:MAG: ferrous iron transport protein B [Thermodesulfobacteriota bacterium]